jgi:arylsulfatase A-like enzyme
MNYRRLASTALATGLAALANAAAAGKPPAPNILFILVDDLGYGDVGAFYQNGRSEGTPRLLTPNLDRMAREGMLLTDHSCAAPVCAPSRGSLMTGMNQGHCDNRDSQFDRPLPPNHTLGTVLRAAGYYTAAMGKWGLAGTTAPWPAHPLNRGFDEYYGFLRHKDAHDHYAGNNGGIFDDFTEVARGLDGIYDSDLFTARAKKFIIDHETRNNEDQPFFLYLAYTLPHMKMQLPPGPYPAGEGLSGGEQWPIDAKSCKPDSYVYPEFRGMPWPAEEKCHASMVHRLDDCVGDILQLVRDLHIERNTLVIFTSDNGPHNEGKDPRFFDSWGPFDGIKRDLFEGGARVPTIAWWPGTVPAGAVNPVLSAQYDWMATFAELAGVPAPARSDGISLLPSLTGQSEKQARHPYLYSEFFGLMKGPITKEILARHGYQTRDQEQYVRMGDFAGVRYQITSPTTPLRLYNLANDPKELHDLSAEPRYQSMLARMRDLLVTARTPDPAAPRPYDQVLLPAVEQPSTTGGVAYRYFVGRWPWLPAFQAMKPNRVATVPSLVLPDAGEKNAFGVEYTGSIYVPADGKYVFTIRSDSGVDFWVHDDLVIDDDYQHDGFLKPPRVGSVLLEAGWHPIRLAYRHDPANGEPLLDVTESGPEMSTDAFAPDRVGWTPSAP